MLKKISQFFLKSFYLLWIAGLVIILISDYQIFTSEELMKLKKDKNFWKWISPYGPLHVHYIEKGKGDKHLILLHGFRSHTYTWRYLIDPLSAAGYHVWALDLVGYGLSDKPDSVPYHGEFFVEQIHAFMENHQISQAHVIGNSMGGGLALNLAVNHPEKVRSLMLISALGYPLDLPLYLMVGRHFDKIWAPFLGPFIIRIGLKQIVYNKKVVTDEQVNAYSLPYRFPGGALASLLTLRQFDNQILSKLSANYKQLKHPLLIIWGEKDSLIPISHYENFCRDFPHAHRLLISNCGHLPQEEEPELVAEALIDFLSSFPT